MDSYFDYRDIPVGFIITIIAITFIVMMFALKQLKDGNNPDKILLTLHVRHAPLISVPISRDIDSDIGTFEYIKATLIRKKDKALYLAGYMHSGIDNRMSLEGKSYAYLPNTDFKYVDFNSRFFWTQFSDLALRFDKNTIYYPIADVIVSEIEQEDHITTEIRSVYVARDPNQVIKTA